MGLMQNMSNAAKDRSRLCRNLQSRPAQLALFDAALQLPNLGWAELGIQNQVWLECREFWCFAHLEGSFVAKIIYKLYF